MASPMPAGSAALPAGAAATWRLLETKGSRFADIPAAQPPRRREGEQRVDRGRRDADDHDPGNGQEPRTGRRMSAAPRSAARCPVERPSCSATALEGQPSLFRGP